jgi:hypothetical protein
MMTFDNKLEIFERFEIDKNLPKYKLGEKVELTPTQLGDVLLPTDPTDSWGTSWINANVFTSTAVTSGIVGSNQIMIYKEDSWLTKKINELKLKFNLVKAKVETVRKEKRKTATIIEFFTSLANNLQDLQTMTDIAVHYETAIKNAANAGQTALVEKLKSRLEPAKTEVQLVAFGLKQYLTEEQIIDFYNKTEKDKHLKLTWIKNFVKQIPTKILDVKVKLDKNFVFDNYVILHYDPNNDATNLTKKEVEERKKDPIIFGLIKDSRRLYYVGDWIDEYCNLTLDVVLETLAEKANEINNNTVKTFIDRGFEKETRIKNAEAVKEVQKKERIKKISFAKVIKTNPNLFKRRRL